MAGHHQHLHRRGHGGANPQALELKRANRHGLIAGATGTGKTVTIQGIIEGLSASRRPVLRRRREGRPVGPRDGRLADRQECRRSSPRAPTDIGMTDWSYADNPVQFWDLFGEQGHPIRTTVSEMGPLLLSRLMDLNEVQEGVLTIAFTVADKDGLLLLDLDDLQAMLVQLRRARRRADDDLWQRQQGSRSARSSARCSSCAARAATISSASRRSRWTISSALDDKGRGIVNILAADKLMQSPQLYSTFLLWLLSPSCSSTFPRSATPTSPSCASSSTKRICCSTTFPRRCSDKIEQVVRLIRSKGVGIYFITQNPIDIPDTVAGQLNNRVQHKLNAFTPRDQAAVERRRRRSAPIRASMSPPSSPN